MNFEIIEKIPYLKNNRDHYYQKVLPTNFTISRLADVLPEHFHMMRWCHSGMYVHPMRPESGLVNYTALRDAHAAVDIKNFRGTAHEHEAFDIEFWNEWRDENTHEWSHEGCYRILFDRIIGQCQQTYMRNVDPQELQYALAEKVREFTKAQDEKVEE